MRYSHLLEAITSPRCPTRPLRRPHGPFDADIKLVVRFMACVYRWVDVSLSEGYPDAEIALDAAKVTYPELYDAEGKLTQDCRRWVIENVHDEVERCGFSMCIVFSLDDAIYCWPNGVLVIAGKPPEGGLPL